MDDYNPNFRTLYLITLIIKGQDDPRLKVRQDPARDVAIRETCALLGLDHNEIALFEYLHEPQLL